jgi:hypothetical protein
MVWHKCKGYIYMPKTATFILLWARKSSFYSHNPLYLPKFPTLPKFSCFPSAVERGAEPRRQERKQGAWCQSHLARADKLSVTHFSARSTNTTSAAWELVYSSKLRNSALYISFILLIVYHGNSKMSELY